MTDEIVRTIVCQIKKVIYQKGLFRILQCKITEHKDKKKIGSIFICKGSVPFEVFANDEIEITGNPVKVYNKFKEREEWQIIIKSVKKTTEGKRLQAKRILTKVKGIGPVKADEIIEKLGDDRILEKLCSSSAAVASLDITPEQAMQVRNLAKRFTTEDKISAKLMKLKITDFQIGKIKEHFKGNLSLDYIKANLFDLVNVGGFGFLTVCKIADAFGVPKSDKKRVRAVIMYALKTLTSSGDCYVEHQDLIDESHKILNISKNGTVVKDELREMVKKCELYHRDIEVFNDSSILPNPKPKFKNDDNGD
jgi:hypothetical protein